jgi:hypothetical protein
VECNLEWGGAWLKKQKPCITIDSVALGVREEVRPVKSEIAIYDLPKLDFRKYISS